MYESVGQRLSVKPPKRAVEEEASDPEEQFYEKQGLRDLARSAKRS